MSKENIEEQIKKEIPKKEKSHPIQILLPSDFGVSKEEIERNIHKLRRSKMRKEKKAYESSLPVVLQKKAIAHMRNEYKSHEIIERGEGYYIVAHPQEIEVMVPYKTIFSDNERREKREFCSVSIIQYGKIDEENIQKYLKMNAKMVLIKK